MHRLPTPQQATRQLVATAAIALAFAGVSAASQPSSPTERVDIDERVIVRGCAAEDDCAIDYTSQGRWIIERVDH